MTVEVATRAERWLVRGAFRIARDTYTAVDVVVVELRDGAHRGRGECRPYAHFGESVDSVRAAVETVSKEIADGACGERLIELLPAGAARFALDSATIDLEAKRSGVPAWRRLELTEPEPVATAFTIGLDEPEVMAARAREAGARRLLKLKVGADGMLDRVRAVHEAVPSVPLIVDANEAWSPCDVEEALASMVGLGVALVEQPLPAGDDAILGEIERPIPVCADESFRGADPMAAIAGRYDAVNVKLDKAGGVTAARALIRQARERGLRVLLGCMVGTSLAVAPALLLASRADWCDLDGPLLLARDRPCGIVDDGVRIHPPTPDLWG